MTGLHERTETSKFSSPELDSVGEGANFAISEKRASQDTSSNTSSSPSFIASAFSIFESKLTSTEKNDTKTSYGWTAALKRFLTGGSMRRLQECIMGINKVDTSISARNIWLLGESYKFSSEETTDSSNVLPAFLQDFSSRIWMTYRKGFQGIMDTKFTGDVGWGCMIRSSQMLVAQALIFHHLGRSWRKSSQMPYDSKYIEILHHFGDSEASAFSIHNLLQAGRGYNLAAGSWVGPYAMCHTWATLAHSVTQHANNKGNIVLPMTIYVVSGDEDGERGGAPVVFIDVISHICCDASKDKTSWTPVLLLVPLVLGLENINTRYISSLSATFSFPQSLGILGGKPGASTYIVGVQDDRAIYLDPHEVQQVVDIKADDLEADTSSYHCSVVRQMPLDLIDPSLAIGFYCRDKDDFDDFCSHASDLRERSNGAPLFTVADSPRPAKSVLHRDNVAAEEAGGAVDGCSSFDGGDDAQEEDEWQIL